MNKMQFGEEMESRASLSGLVSLVFQMDGALTSSLAEGETAAILVFRIVLFTVNTLLLFEVLVRSHVMEGTDSCVFPQTSHIHAHCVQRRINSICDNISRRIVLPSQLREEELNELLNLSSLQP